MATTTFSIAANGTLELLKLMNYSSAQRILGRIGSNMAGVLELQISADDGTSYVTVEQVATTALTTIGSYAKVAKMDVLAPAQGRLIYRDTSGNASAGVWECRVYNDNSR